MKSSRSPPGDPLYEGFFPVAIIIFSIFSIVLAVVEMAGSGFDIPSYFTKVGEVGGVAMIVLSLAATAMIIVTVSGMVRHRRPDVRDKFYAKISCFLSIGFFIPLFNIPLCIAAVITSAMALKNNSRDPEHYGGRAYAIVGLVLGITGIVLTIIGLVIYLLSDRICGSAVCTAYIRGLK